MFERTIERLASWMRIGRWSEFGIEATAASDSEWRACKGDATLRVWVAAGVAPQRSRVDSALGIDGGESDVGTPISSGRILLHCIERDLRVLRSQAQHIGYVCDVAVSEPEQGIQAVLFEL